MLRQILLDDLRQGKSTEKETNSCHDVSALETQISVSFVCGPQYSDETLAVFKSYKLDDMQASKRKLDDLRASGGDHVYFAKFLTSEKVRKVF